MSIKIANVVEIIGSSNAVNNTNAAAMPVIIDSCLSFITLLYAWLGNRDSMSQYSGDKLEGIHGALYYWGSSELLRLKNSAPHNGTNENFFLLFRG